MLRRRPAGARLVESAAGQERDDRQHLRARTELEDRKQVGQVVAQHVARRRDRVDAGPHASERLLHRLDWRADRDVQTRRVVILQVLLRLGDHVAVVGALWIQPEDRRVTGQPGPVHRQLHPVADRQVLRPAHAPDVAGFDAVLEDRRAAGVVTRTTPSRGISNVLSCEPYSSALCAMRPTFDTVPIVFTSNAPFVLQSSMTA